MPLPRCVLGGTSVLSAQTKLLSEAQEREGGYRGKEQRRGAAGLSGRSHAGLREWASLYLKAQEDGEEGGPLSNRQGRRGGALAPARPFRGGLMHQTSIFRTIELVIFFS